ncbi:MAG TPA: L-threonylcarbamoyladenylate synthase [Candidatus Binatia bacterium]|nr:L-threonylcarbamoyladenylate synthase [Candidatus Binatia bacterium]
MNLSQAIASLERGDVVVFPTETVYGLGADALNPAAVEKVFQLKGRNPDTPIPIIVADQAMLKDLVEEIPSIARKLMERFWPGPLTLVLPAVPGTPKQLLNRTGGIGVRISSQPIATQLARELRRPLTATSANPSGQPAASTIEQAQNYFAGEIEIFLDGGKLPSKTGSSVVEVSDDRIKIIREGEISAAQLAVSIGRKNILA